MLLKEKQCLTSQVSKFHCRYIYKLHTTAEPCTRQVSSTLPALFLPLHVVKEQLIPAYLVKISSLHTTLSPALCQKTALPNAMFMSSTGAVHPQPTDHERQQPGKTFSSECNRISDFNKTCHLLQDIHMLTGSPAMEPLIYEQSVLRAFWMNRKNISYKIIAWLPLIFYVENWHLISLIIHTTAIEEKGFLPLREK